MGKRVGVKSLDIIAVVDIASTLAVVLFLSRGSVQMDGDVVVLALVIGSRMLYLNIIPVRGFSKHLGSTTIESGSRYICFLKSFVFSDENYMTLLYCLYFHVT